MTNNQNPDRKKANSLLWASRIFASAIVLIFAFFFIPAIYEGITREGSYLPENNKWEGVIMTVWFIMLVAGYIFSWIKELPGGIIMILAGLTVALPFIILANNLGSLIFGGASIAAGLLFIIYWRDMRRKRVSDQSQ
jgi:hypothetical protein